MEEAVSVETNNTGGWQPKNRFTRFLDRWFFISERGSSIVRELVGGLVTFLAMFYILPLNAGMLSSDWAGEEGIIHITADVTATASQVWAAVFVATALSAAVTTILMGIFGKLPIGLASGLGLNSLIAFTVLLGLNMTFAEAMMIVLVDGILFLIISITPLRAWIVKHIPKSLKFAITAGIGFFIAFIGLSNCGIITQGVGTPVDFGDFTSLPVLMGILGIVLVIVFAFLGENKALGQKGVWISRFGVIISIVIMGIICGSLGTAGVDGFSPFYSEAFHLSELGNFGKIFGCLFVGGWSAFANPIAYAVMFSLLFVDFFDTAGTLVAVENGVGIMGEDGQLKEGYSDRGAMVIDAVGTVFGAICGTSTVTSFSESATGVAAGARTGLASVVTGLLFALSILIYPVLSMFSTSAVTSLAMVYVGILMFKNLELVEWKNFISVGSGFITVLVMTVSYSISDGIAWGFISYTIMTLVAGKFKKSDVPVACCSVAFLVLYIVENTVL